MKKMYLKPVAELIGVEALNFVCASVDKTIVPTAEWGDKGQYAPEEWINEKHTSTYDWPSVGIEEDAEDELYSRSKGFTW